MARATALTLLGRALLATALPGAAVSAQAPVAAAIVRGDELHAVMKPEEALTIFEEVLFDAPHDYDVLWRAARESAALGTLASDGRVSKGRYRQAETYARLAVSARRERPEGHYWLAVALLRQTAAASPQAQVSLLGEVRREAKAVLALEPDHPGALDVLGAWNAQVMRMSGPTSMVAKNLLAGDALKSASWDEAERLLSRAAELEPACLAHHFELARVYMDTGQPEPARRHLQTILSRPATEVVDPVLKDQARALLMTLQSGTG